MAVMHFQTKLGANIIIKSGNSIW